RRWPPAPLTAAARGRLQEPQVGTEGWSSVEQRDGCWVTQPMVRRLPTPDSEEAEILVLNLRFQTLDAFCGDTAALDKTRVIKDEKRCAPARRFSPIFGFVSDFTRGCQSPGRCTRQRPIRSLIFRARCESCRLLAQFLGLSPRSSWEWPLGSDCLPLSPRRSR